MDDQERESYLSIVKTTPDELTSTLKGMPKKLLLWSPAPGKWSIHEIVCHMRDMEQDAYLNRYQRILAEENPVLPNIDGDAYALEKQYRRQKLSGVLRDWKRLRKENLKLLKKVQGDQWQRPGVHETDGPLTLEIILKRQAIGNDQAHLSQIAHIKLRYEILKRFEEGMKTVEEEIRATPEAALRQRPEQKRWSIMENLGHLMVIEQLFLSRYVAIAYTDRPKLALMDNDAWAARLKFNDLPLRETLAEFKRLRAETIKLLSALPQQAWKRIGVHPSRGENTIESQALHHSQHDSHHVEAMRRLRQQLSPS